MVVSKNVEILENVENLEDRKRCCVLREFSSPKNEPLQIK